MEHSYAETFQMFTCSYRYAGKKWSVDFPATSFADAEARLSALHFGKVDGILGGTIPAYPGVGVYVRVMTRLRNTFRVSKGAQHDQK